MVILHFHYNKQTAGDIENTANEKGGGELLNPHVWIVEMSAK